MATTCTSAAAMLAIGATLAAAGCAGTDAPVLTFSGSVVGREADVIRRLVTQWGGQLMDKVNVDTDFVVLGAEPVLPTFTREDLQDPFNAKRLADAQAAMEAYDQVRNRARDLHIPIMNQNRFLYLIGFYNQARR